MIQERVVAMSLYSIFFPDVCFPSSDSFILGWTSDQNTILLLCFLPKHTFDHQRVSNALNDLKHSSVMQALSGVCFQNGKLPLIIGEYLACSQQESPPRGAHQRRLPETWLVLQGNIDEERPTSTVDQRSATACGPRLISLRHDGKTCSGLRISLYRYPPLQSHLTLRYFSMPAPLSATPSNFELVLRQINLTGKLNSMLDEYLLGRPNDGTQIFQRSRARSASGSRGVLKISNKDATKPAFNIFHNAKPLGSLSYLRNPSALAPFSLLLGHLVAEVRGALRWFGCLRKLRQRPSHCVIGRPAAQLAAAAARVPAQLAADWALGVAAALLLGRYFGQEQCVAAGLRGLRFLSTAALQENVAWLNSYPAGLKLNPPLARALGGLAGLALQLRQRLLAQAWALTAAPAGTAAGVAGGGAAAVWVRAAAARAVMASGFGGLSTLLAVAFDAFRLITLHIVLIRKGFAAAMHVYVSLLVSFWRFFRGKKKNILRNRVDTRHCDATQLLLGTAIFTVLFFLFPTVLVYYVYFTVLRVSIAVIQTLLLVAFSIATQSPVYDLYLFTQKHRLPWGVQFDWVRCPRHQAALTPSSDASCNGNTDVLGKQGNYRLLCCYFQLRGKRKPLSLILAPLTRTLKQLVWPHGKGLGGLLALVVEKEAILAEEEEEAGVQGSESSQQQECEETRI